MADTFQKPKSGALRIWHWANSIAIFGLLATGLLRKSYMSWRPMAATIESKTADAGVAVTPELAREIAIAIRTPMWENHYLFGFALAALLLMRVVLAFMSGQTHTIQDLKDAIASRDKHTIAVKGLYLAFYGVVAFMVSSGLLLRFKTELGLSKELSGLLKDGHEFFLWGFVGFVALHIAGVFVTELRGEHGLVSRMIHGGQKS